MAPPGTLNKDEISIFSGGNCGNMILLAQENRAVESGDLDGLHWRESGLNQKFDLALIAKSWNDSAVAGRIRPGQEQTSRLNKFAFQFHVAFEKHRPVSFRRLQARGPLPGVKVSRARFRRPHIQDTLLQR